MGELFRPCGRWRLVPADPLGKDRVIGDIADEKGESCEAVKHGGRLSRLGVKLDGAPRRFPMVRVGPGSPPSSGLGAEVSVEIHGSRLARRALFKLPFHTNSRARTVVFQSGQLPFQGTGLTAISQVATRSGCLVTYRTRIGHFCRSVTVMLSRVRSAEHS